MKLKQPAFLPTNRQEMRALGWEALDILLVTGDAYVDHPSFGAALLGRLLVARGLRTGIVAQPRWTTPEDVSRMGRPRLFAGVTAGALDSMLAHYTAFRKKRHDDAYTPGGRAGARPNRAVIVYSNLVRQAFPGLLVVLGGIEASLRRITHYDFWSDSLRRSILLDAKADLLVWGMGEIPLVSVARALLQAESTGLTPDLTGIPGTAWMGRPEQVPEGRALIELPSHESLLENPRLLMQATLASEHHVQRGDAWAVQAVGGRTLVLAPPPPPPNSRQLDEVFALPFSRRAHPGYTEAIPAEEMMRWSINTHRGCGGGCSFCSLALHQGRRVASRSRISILREVQSLTRMTGWTGSISDVGGPSANMWGARCTLDPARCTRTSCLFPAVCPGFQVDQSAGLELLREVARQDGVRHVRVASGLRHDLALQAPRALKALIMEFTGGQLKVAPEHISENVLRGMRKPSLEVFERFLEEFRRHSEAAGKEQYVIPYLISAFPGCTEQDMRELADWLRARGWTPRQVQCFIPTPGTVATAMYFTGLDPEGNPIHVARSDAERLRQHGLLSPERGRKPVRCEGSARPPRSRRGGEAKPSGALAEGRKPDRAPRTGRPGRRPG
ncbi:MAG: YgiQ family radical SAM protein [Candidatus Xenobium sp.]|jgi:uncharacterized radical SAM protein YgiQ|nr:YgiQ family radical SAM protein [Burkholderiales bacterium]